MYKFLLCWRYLRTRYLAVICIISVMLGVATLIVVNSVMSGFSSKLRTRLHGFLSDVVVESSDMFGFDRYQEKMERIRNDPILRDKVDEMAATMEIFALAQFTYHRDGYEPHPITRRVQLIGVEPEERAKLGGFKEHLVRMKHEQKVAFKLDAEGLKRYRATKRHPLERALSTPAWTPEEQAGVEIAPPTDPLAIPDGMPMPPPLDGPDLLSPPVRPAGSKDPEIVIPHVAPDRAEDSEIPCAIVGHAIVHQRRQSSLAGDPDNEYELLKPGESFAIVTVGGSQEQLSAAGTSFVVCDYIKTGMSEYDSNIVYVPLDVLQRLRAKDVKKRGWSRDRVTHIQIKLHNYADAKLVVDRLREIFQYEKVRVETWEDKQGPLLAAIDIEKGILNVLLFLIIAVAGFGILAIFSMIVMEKTRDVGIMKALGASNLGIMKIFLGYGLLLGLVGAIFGTALGLLITDNVNELEKFIAEITGHDIFDRSIYYFDKIPVQVDSMTVLMVNLGAVAIAVLFSVLPAMRAAMLHPVKALRFE